MEEKQEVIFEEPEKPEQENIITIQPNREDFEDSDKAHALIKNLSLSVGDTLRENENYFIVNPKMVLRGNAPKHYEKDIKNLKKILTEKEIKAVSQAISKRTKDYDKKLYNRVKKRFDGFYWRGEIKKSLSEEIREALESLKSEQSSGAYNTLYHLLSKEKKDFIYCYKCAWRDKPTPNIQEWAEENDGEYRVLTDSEADSAVDDYFDDDYLWKQAVEAGQTTDSFEGWKDHVINMDGRGSLLNGYDGCEEYEGINGTDYYIYRTN